MRWFVWPARRAVLRWLGLAVLITGFLYTAGYIRFFRLEMKYYLAATIARRSFFSMSRTDERETDFREFVPKEVLGNIREAEKHYEIYFVRQGAAMVMLFVRRDRGLGLWSKLLYPKAVTAYSPGFGTTDRVYEYAEYGI